MATRETVFFGISSTRQGPPPHSDIPYAFKPLCFREAQKQGYDLVLWLDASIVIKKSVEPLFDLIRQDGYLLFEEFHSVGEYCKDEALAPLGITREESFRMPSVWSCVLGLDLTQPTGLEFLRNWEERALDGITFPGPKWSGRKGWPRTASKDYRVKGHRYDQTAASVIALKLGMDKWQPKVFFSEYFDNARLSVRVLKEYKDNTFLESIFRTLEKFTAKIAFLFSRR